MSLDVWFDVYKKKLTLQEVTKMTYEDELKFNIGWKGYNRHGWLCEWINNYANKERTIYGDCCAYVILNREDLVSLINYCSYMLNNKDEWADPYTGFGLLESDEDIIDKEIRRIINKFKNYVEDILDKYNENYTYSISYNF